MELRVLLGVFRAALKVKKLFKDYEIEISCAKLQISPKSFNNNLNTCTFPFLIITTVNGLTGECRKDSEGQGSCGQVDNMSDVSMKTDTDLYLQRCSSDTRSDTKSICIIYYCQT